MMITKPLILLFITMLAACQPSIVPPSLDEVVPNWGFNGDETNVTLNGTNLFPGIEAKGGAIDGFNRDFMAYLHGPTSSSMNSVRLTDAGKLSAVVPRGLPVGWYDLEVRAPSGGEARLSEAFEVTDTRADHIRLTVDTNTPQVHEFVILRASVRDPTGDIVEDENPIVITVEGGSNNADVWLFDFGDISGPEILEDGAGIRGDMTPSGEIYFGFKSDEPGDFRIHIEADIRDRVSLQSSALVQFRAGAVEDLSIRAVDYAEDRRAGEPFEVDLRLEDAYGNTVSGVVATIVLSEECTGGQFQQVATFVDDARVTVAPTKACDDNMIVGFGVVEGQTISGSSMPFTVTGGGMSGLDVRATPTSVQAGMDSVSLWIQAQDAWGNNVAEDPGTIALNLDGVSLSESAGTGTYACTDGLMGASSCEVGLFQIGDAVAIHAQSTSGAEGLSNPVVVRPGPVAELQLRSSTAAVTAGMPFSISISALDGFGNRRSLSSMELDETEFYDLHGPMDCVFLGPAATFDTYDYDCVLTKAGVDNEVRAVIPSLGADGVFGPMGVRAGPVQQIDMRLGPEIEDGGIAAGINFTVALEASDEFGNLAEGTTEVEIDDITGSIRPTSLVLSEGVGSTAFNCVHALKGNSVWAWVDGKRVGGTHAFDVHPGEPVGISAILDTPWGFEESMVNVEVTITDEFGNPHYGDTHPVTLIADTIMYSDTPVKGKHSFQVPTTSAGLIEPIRVATGEWSTETVSIPIARECSDTPAMRVDVTGPEAGRLCLLADGTGSAALSAPPEASTLRVLVNANPITSEDGASATVTWTAPGAKRIQSFMMNDALCGWEDEFTLFAAPERSLTGDVLSTSSSGLLTAGASDEYATTEVWIQGRECSGDVASGAEVLVQPTLGTITITEDTELTAPDPVDRITLDASGEASFFWSMRDESQGGTAGLLFGTSDGRAYGYHEVDVLGDAIPPNILSVEPGGFDMDPFDFVAIRFSESMLDVGVDVAALDYVKVHGPDGEINTVSDWFWSDEQRELKVVLSDSIDPTLGGWQLTVSDDFRDLAGNRLDGDWDGESGGLWDTTFDAVETSGSVLRDCFIDSGWIYSTAVIATEPELLGARMNATATIPVMWWAMHVENAKGEVVHYSEFLRTGLTSSTLYWNGKQRNSHAAPNGLYTARLTPLTASRTPGTSCWISFVVDNPLEPSFDGG